jgi:excisionase family DNA binding protein
MEKICIVKRRQQSTQSEVKGTMPNGQTINIHSEESQNNASLNTKTLPEKNIVEEFNDESGHIISIIMTNEQSSMLQSSEYIRDLLRGRRSDPSLHLNRSSDGRIIFNFCLHESPTVRMLRFDQVCQMLQISRSFLQKLVHEKSLKSYKLGRLRRFAMEDVLDYLTSNEELERRVDGY